MAKRYPPLTVVVLVGAFALLGYMGARLSQKQASLQIAGAPPPAVHPTDNVHLTDKKSLSPNAPTPARSPVWLRLRRSRPTRASTKGRRSVRRDQSSFNQLHPWCRSTRAARRGI